MRKLFTILSSTAYLAVTRVTLAADFEGGGGGGTLPTGGGSGGSGFQPTGGGGGISPVGDTGDFTLPNPLQTNSIVELIDRVIFYLTIIASPILAIMIIWGAFQILTAGGDPGKVRTGKQTILYAAVGFGIILLARGLIAILQQLLGVEQRPDITSENFTF